MKEHAAHTISKSDGSLSSVLDDIKKFRKEINERLDELEQQAEDAAMRILQENRENLNKVETACSDVTIFLEKAANELKHLNTSKQSDKLFMELKHAEEMVKQYEIKFDEFTNFDIKEFNFNPNKTISSLLSVKEINLGTFLPITLQMKSRLICNQSKICAQTLREKQMCSITGMTLVSPEFLAIADNRNMTVKMVDVCNQRLTALLNLYTEPWDVTTISINEVAVTLPGKQTIQFLSVSSNKLIKKHAIQTDGECYGISCNQGKIVVLFNDPAKLQIIDIDNNTVLTTVGAGITFINPLYVIADEISIYVTDGEMRKLLRLNWQGDAISSYGDMKNPSKIAFSDSGTVFVCDLQRNVIEEVLEDCSRGKVVLRNVKSPRAICWCPETNRMYMSCGTDDGTYDNVIHIYKML
jgi:primosomal protein N''